MTMTKKPHVEPAQLTTDEMMLVETLANTLIRQVTLARGTRDLEPAPSVTPSAPTAKGAAAPSAPRTPGERGPGEYAQVRRRRPATEADTSKPAPDVSKRDTSTSELYQKVQSTLSDKPYTFRDLVGVLGLEAKDENRVKSIIVRLQRDGAPLVNLGNGSRAIWWIDVHGRIEAIARGENRVSSRKK